MDKKLEKIAKEYGNELKHFSSDELKDILLVYGGAKPAATLDVRSFYDKSTNSAYPDKNSVKVLETVLDRLGLKYEKKVEHYKSMGYVASKGGTCSAKTVKECNTENVSYLIAKTKGNLEKLEKALSRSPVNKKNLGEALGYGTSSADISNGYSNEYMTRLAKDKQEGKKIPEELATLSFVPPIDNYTNDDVMKIAKKNAKVLKKLAPEAYESAVRRFDEDLELYTERLLTQNPAEQEKKKKSKSR